MQTKNEILAELRTAFSDLTTWIETRTTEEFTHCPVEGKWCIGEHLDHLVVSNSQITYGFTVPKVALSLRMGKRKHKERDYDGVVDFYQSFIQKGGKASGKFVPKNWQSYTQEQMFQKLTKDTAKLYDWVETNWTEKQLSAYVLPHPLMGKISMREMLYFHVFHNRLHLQLMQRDYS